MYFYVLIESSAAALDRELDYNLFFSRAFAQSKVLPWLVKQDKISLYG